VIAASPATSEADRRRVLAAVLLPGLAFASGASALLYQLLWMRTFSLLLGNGAQAAAATLAAFFLGLGLGSRVLGRRLSGTGNPLRALAILEAGIAAGAIWFTLLAPALGGLALAAEQPGPVAALLATLVRLGLATLAVLPAAFCMGGTLPVLGEAVTAGMAGLGHRVALVYGVNTLGAALGAALGAFVLLPVLGHRGTLGVALAVTASVALLAWRAGHGRTVTRARPAAAAPARWRPSRLLAAAAGVSGLAALGLEVLWTRMFAQVFHNSVYSFGIVLVTFLLALGAGALVARGLARRELRPPAVLRALWTVSGVLVAASPFVFHRVTAGLGYVGHELGFAGYLGELFGVAALVLLAPVAALGTIFPYLWRLAEREAQRAGETVGDLAALNVAGAVAGSLAAGFLVLPWLGLWGGIGLFAALYVVAAMVLVPGDEAPQPVALRLAPAVAMLLLVSVFSPAQLAAGRAVGRGGGELLVAHRQGPDGVVSVVRRGDALALKMNGFYTLGSTAGAAYEARQAHFPLAIHGEARAVFFLGLGTGITAGAALAHPLEELVVAELSAGVVRMAREHFAPYANGLFSDPRARILVEDGRSFLAHSEQRFDVIVSDLFVPWRAGVGALYTREHYAAARARLRAGGILCQWLPMFQLDARSFETIARTFLEVFPETTLWRGDFFGRGSIVALCGHTASRPLSPARVRAAHRALARAGGGDDGAPARASDLLLYYAGNLGAARHLLAGAVVDTDDRLRIGFHAPVAQRRVAAGEDSWLDGEALLGFLAQVLEAVPPARDPFLAGLDERAHARVHAGLALHRAQVLRLANREQEAQRALATFRHLVASERESAPGAVPGPRAALRRELEALRTDLERRLEALEERLPALEPGW